MNRSSVTTASVFCAAFVLILAMAPRISAKPLLSEKQIFDQLNQERQKAGLAPLEWNELLAEAARSHSQAMAEKDKLAHQLAGEPPLQERIALRGVRFIRAGENIALTGYVEDVHLALMTSAGHRANMLNPKYNAVGIGVIEQNGKIYVTQDFAFQVPVYSEAEFGAALAERLQLPRKDTGVWKVNAKPDPLMHDLACSTDGDAAKLSDGVSGSYLVVFSASEPRLPEELQKDLAARGYYRMKFGVCFRPDKEHGPGNFWVVAAFS
ncbi:MAG TPA: CAP domain-containing protein [Candidatus Angelobacter sp.]|nr:CAP domain-containing protein [Candidatus Angelobacter sp.]